MRSTSNRRNASSSGPASGARRETRGRRALGFAGREPEWRARSASREKRWGASASASEASAESSASASTALSSSMIALVEPIDLFVGERERGFDDRLLTKLFDLKRRAKSDAAEHEHADHDGRHPKGSEQPPAFGEPSVVAELRSAT